MKSQQDLEREKEIISTYRTIISVLKNMPGMRMEDAFRSCSAKELEQEKEYLETVFKDKE